MTIYIREIIYLINPKNLNGYRKKSMIIFSQNKIFRNLRGFYIHI